MKKLIIILAFILVGLGILYFIDPAFKREVTFDDYSVKYDWRLFNNSYCNFKTAGHCYDNETNRINAEIELYLTLLANVDGNKRIEKKLKDIVRNTYRFDRTYMELTQADEVKIDSLKKYKNEIFRKTVLK